MAVSGSGTTDPAVGEHTVNTATEINITANPAENHIFVSWTIKGNGTLKAVDSASTTVTLTGATAITANFVHQTAKLTISVSGNGTTGPVAGEHTVNTATEISISATPAKNHVFAGWTVTGDGTLKAADSASTTVTLTGNAAVTVKFVHATATLTMAVNGSGTTDPAAGDHTVQTAVEITITATPEANFIFTGFTLTGDGTLNDKSSKSATVTLAGNVTVTANFVHETAKLTVSVNGEGTTSPAAGEHSVNTAVKIPVKAVPAVNNVFVSWTIEGDGKADDPGSAETDVTITGDTKLTANFAKLVQLTMMINPENGGTVIPAEGVHTVKTGEAVEITASPAAGNYFVKWEVTGGGTINGENSETAVVTLTDNAVVTAYFAAEVDSAVTLSYPNGGEIFRRDDKITITWASSADISNIRIELLNEGVIDTTITADTENDGSYEWTVPAQQAEGNYYKIRISGIKADTALKRSTTVSDESDDYFSIAGESFIKLISPAGGEFWSRETTQNIEWESGTISGNIKIDLYKSGAFVKSIDSSTANDGVYEWAISGETPLGNDYKVKVSSVSDAAISDISSTSFAVTGGTSATLTMKVSPESTGETDPAIGTHTVHTGIPVAISATAADGHTFVKWKFNGQGNVTATDKSETTAVITGDSAITAIFIVDNDGVSTFVKVAIDLDSSKADNDKINIRKASLPDSITDTDIENGELKLMVDDFELTFAQNTGKYRRGNRKNKYTYKYTKGRSRASLDFNLEEGKRYWSLTGSKLAMSSDIDNQDGVDIYLAIDDKMFGDNLKMDEENRWKFINGDSTALSVSGIPMTEFSIKKATGKYSTGKVKRDNVVIRQASFNTDDDFHPTTHTVKISVDDWEKVMHADSAKKVSPKRNIWKYSGTTYAGARFSLMLNPVKNKWKFKIINADLASEINAGDGIDVILQAGNYEGGVKLDVEQKATLIYPKKEQSDIN